MCYGAELISKALDRWVYDKGVTLDFWRHCGQTARSLLAIAYIRTANRWFKFALTHSPMLRGLALPANLMALA